MGGNPLCCAGALAVLDIMDEEKLVEKAAANGELLKNRLLGLMKKFEFIGDVRGMGLVYGVEFVKNRETKEPAPDLTRDIVVRCVANGLMCGKLGVHGNVMRVAPPLVITPDEIEKSAAILEKVLEGM